MSFSEKVNRIYLNYNSTNVKIETCLLVQTIQSHFILDHIQVAVDIFKEYYYLAFSQREQNVNIEIQWNTPTLNSRFL